LVDERVIGESGHDSRAFGHRDGGKQLVPTTLSLDGDLIASVIVRKGRIETHTHLVPWTGIPTSANAMSSVTSMTSFNIGQGI
jgi:hypothetical protein